MKFAPLARFPMLPVYRIVGVLIIVWSLWMISAMLRQHSIAYYTDIGRDMLLIQELMVKKVSLIGARTSLQGVFHGPLWYYINLPAFILTKGNVVLMGWWWFALIAAFLVEVFVVVRKLFDEQAAWVVTSLTALSLIQLHFYFTNPIGAFFCIPLFLYTMVQYDRSDKPLWLAAHIILGGMIVQFEMMIGIPLLVLSFLWTVLLRVKRGKWQHLLVWSVVLLPLSTFIVYELKYHFPQLQSMIAYATGKTGEFYLKKDFLTVLMQHVELLLQGAVGVFYPSRFTALNTLPLLSLAAYWGATRTKKESWKRPLTILAFFDIGFYIVTLVFKDTLLFHYYYPLMLLPLIAFAGVHHKVAKPLGVFVIFLAIVVGMSLGVQETKQSLANIGVIENDWATFRHITPALFADGEKEFGYFIYAADIYGYQAKYAFGYEVRLHPQVHAMYNTKAKVTYLVIGPPSGTNKELLAADWKRDKVGVVGKPNKSVSLAGGYTLEKYILSDADVAKPYDKDFGELVHFR